MASALAASPAAFSFMIQMTLMNLRSSGSPASLPPTPHSLGKRSRDMRNMLDQAHSFRWGGKGAPDVPSSKSVAYRAGAHTPPPCLLELNPSADGLQASPLVPLHRPASHML